MTHDLTKYIFKKILVQKNSPNLVYLRANMSII